MAGPLLRLIVGLACACWLLAAPAHAQDVPISDEARKEFDIGVKLLQDPDGARYEEAHRAFKRAYAASPSPKILLNLGICAMKLERDSEALWALQEHLAKVADIDPQVRSQVETDIATLEGGMVKLDLSISPSGATVEDERIPVSGSRILNVYGPLAGPLDVGIRAGRHQLRIALAGHETVTLSFEAEPGKPIARQIELVPVAEPQEPAVTPLAPEPPAPAPTSSGPNVVAFVMVGVTAALAIGTAVTGGLALAKAGEFDEVNDGTQVEEAQARRDGAQTLNIATDILLGLTAASAVVTVVLFAVPIGADDGSDTAGWELAPAAGPGGGQLSLRGAF
jgi:hypothetical protein